MDTNNLNTNQYNDLSQIEKDKKLLEASQLGKVEKVKALLDAGANINARDTKFYVDRTPMMKATVTWRLEVMKLLIERGADLELTDPEGFTALIWAARDAYGKTDALKVLINAGANIQAKTNRNETALMWAAFDCFPDMVDYLIEKGASVSEVTTYNLTALGLISFKKKQVIEEDSTDKDIILKKYDQIMYSLLSAMSIEEYKKEIELDPHYAPTIQSNYEAFKKTVIDHRINLFKLFGTLALDDNKNNIFSMLTPEIIGIISAKYVEIESKLSVSCSQEDSKLNDSEIKPEIKNTPSWHKHHAPLEGVAICKALNALTFTPSFTGQVENKLKRKQEESENNSNNNNTSIVNNKKTKK